MAFRDLLGDILKASDVMTFKCEFESVCLPVMNQPERLTLRLPFNWRMYRCMEWARRDGIERPLNIEMVDSAGRPVGSLRLIGSIESLQTIPAKFRGSWWDMERRQRPVREMEIVFVYREPELIRQNKESR